MIIFKLGILGIDYTALIIPISLILTMLTFLKYDFLEVKTLARETIFEKSSIGMLIIDRSYRVIDYNRAAEHFFLFFDIQLQNFSIESSDNKELIELFKSEKMQEYKLNDGDKERFFEIDSIVIMDTYGRNGGTLKYIRDVTEKKKIMEELNTLATIDEMSKLNNRRHFLQLAQQEVERVKRYNQVFSFLMMDIDDFKSINDTYGHAAGDVVIHEMGRLINENFRKTDICGRLGGEEFTVILTNTSIEKALAVAEQFRHLVEQTKVFYGDARINFTISIGVTFYCDKMQNLEELLKYVDEALYEAKDKGRNCIVCKSICER